MDGKENMIKDIVVSKGDIIKSIKVISDVFYKPVGKANKMRRYFKIQCLKCGETMEALEISLKHKRTGQCKRCRSNEGRMKGNPQNHNKYDFFNDICIGYTNNGEQFFIDSEDYEKVKDYCWHINAQGYVATQKDKKKILMHRMLLNVPNDKDVDHNNRIRNWNLKNNLTIVTQRENNQNHSIYKNNTSGTTGVYFDKVSGLWRTYINIDKQRIYGGNFKTINDAINNRKELEAKYFCYLKELLRSQIFLLFKGIARKNYNNIRDDGDKK